MTRAQKLTNASLQIAALRYALAVRDCKPFSEKIARRAMALRVAARAYVLASIK